MSFFSKSRWFQKTAVALFCAFAGLMILVIVAAYSRKSGNTGLDMAKIKQLRYHHKKQDSVNF